MQRATSFPDSTLRLVRLGVFAFIAWLYLVRLGAGTLWDNSEPTYGEIVKELFGTGDWLTLHFNYQPWYIHPPLWFWTAGASVAVFGLNEFALRLPGALFGLLTVGATYLGARRIYGEVAGLIAALALGTSLEFVMLSRLAILDSMLLFFTTVATFWIYFAIREDNRSAFWTAVAAASLGTLTKGPVATILPVLVLVAYLLWSRRPLPRTLPWIGGALLYLVLAGSWFAVETVVHGPSFLTAYFGLSNVGRFLSPFENQPGPFWYYIPVAAIGFFPYVAFLPKALKVAWQNRGQDELYLLLSAVMPFLFFSLAQTKLPNYIAVIFPSFAVLVGRVFRDAIAENRLLSLRGALIFLPASLVLLTIGIVLYGETQVAGPFRALIPSLALLGWVVVPLAVATVIGSLWANRVWLAPAGLAAIMGGFIAVAAFSILPKTEAFKPMKAMAAILTSKYRTGDKVGITGVAGGYSLLFYTHGRGLTFVGAANADVTPQDFFSQRARVLCVMPPRDYSDFKRLGIHMWVLAREPRMWLVTNRPPDSLLRPTTKG